MEGRISSKKGRISRKEEYQGRKEGRKVIKEGYQGRKEGRKDM